MRRPSRRDRRVPAYGSPGGRVALISYAAVTAAIGNTKVILRVLRIKNDDADEGVEFATPIGSPLPTPDSVKIYTPTGRLDVSTVTMSVTGVITVTLASGFTGKVTVVVPPYQRAFYGLNGEINMGGVGSIDLA